MRNIKLTIEYDGTRYQGWQRPGKKENPNTISGKITDALQRMTGETIDLIGSVKTEAGVHAASQIAHFKTESTFSTEEIRNYLNHYLPQDISILSADEVPERFHASLNARSKTYVYRIGCTPVENVFLRKYRYHTTTALDLKAMQQAAELLVGKHDFRNFSSGKNKKSTEKELFSVEIITTTNNTVPNPSGNAEDHEIQIHLKGSDFLHQMPQNIVGTLLEIGEEKRNAECISAIFEGEETASPAVATYGLFLKKVGF